MRRILCFLALSGLVLLTALPVAAFEFGKGDLTGNLDTTLSYGLSWRVQDQDDSIIGTTNGGTARSVNGDDGNLNYDKGIVSNVVKVTSELALNYRRKTGIFVRGTGFYDFENADRFGARERTDLTEDAIDLVGKDARVLDAFVWQEFNLGSVPIQLRAGEQVVSWGEGTFLQNSINAINPVNVNALRIPGSEVKEALLPEGMVWGSIGITGNITLEGLYLYDWDRTKIDPPGSYWSTNDFAGDGGEKVMLGFGAVSDMADAPALETFMAVPRGPDMRPDETGQFGLASRVFAPALNNTEFGFYYLNYNSRLPVSSGRTGTLAGAMAAGAIGAATIPVATAVGTHLAMNPGDIMGAIAAGTAVGVGAGASLAASQAIAGTAATVGGNVASVARAFATDAFAKTAQYIIEYPEDIELFGVSFNTMLEGSGIALQGEYSFRKDMPLQVDDVELLLCSLGAINPALAQTNQIGNYLQQFETYIPGYIERDVSQVLTTASKIFGPTLGASQFVLLGEVGLTYVHNMPRKSKLRLDGPGTYISGNKELAAAYLAATGAEIHFGESESHSRFADQASWGYRLVCRLDYKNAIGAINLSPRIAWQHDVDGNSPGPGGNFLENRQAITFGITADYQLRWAVDLSYTNFFGGGRYNLVNDRDVVAANIKYSF